MVWLSRIHISVSSKCPQVITNDHLNCAGWAIMYAELTTANTDLNNW